MMYLRMIFSLLLILTACRSEPAITQPTEIPTLTPTEEPAEISEVHWMDSEILTQDSATPIPDKMLLIFVSRDNEETDKFAEIFSDPEIISTLNENFYSILMNVEDYSDYEDYEMYRDLAPSLVIFHGRGLVRETTSIESLFLSKEEYSFIHMVLLELGKEIQMHGYVSTQDAINIATKIKENHETVPHSH